jgi:hypothetical protein
LMTPALPEGFASEPERPARKRTFRRSERSQTEPLGLAL